MFGFLRRSMMSPHLTYKGFNGRKVTVNDAKMDVKKGFEVPHRVARESSNTPYVERHCHFSIRYAEITVRDARKELSTLAQVADICHWCM